VKERKPYDTKALLETSIDLTKAKDFDTIAEILFDFVEDIVPINMSVLYVIEADGQSLKPRSCRGAKLENLLKRDIFRLGEGGVGYVAREKQALLLTDVKKSTDLPIRIRQVRGEDPHIRSFLAVPLIVNNQVTGVLSASSSKPNRYTMHDVEIVSIVANQVAALVEVYARMQDTQRFSDLILENMNSGVVVTDNAGTVIMMNRTGEAITGYSQSTTRGRSILNLKFLDRETKNRIKACLEGKEDLFESSGTIFVRRTGEKRSIKMSSSSLFTGERSRNGIIIIFRDVTEVEALQRRLSRYEKLTALGKWTSSISHEVFNSLLPIRTSIGLLKSKLSTGCVDGNVAELLGIIEEEGERLNRFLNRLNEADRPGKTGTSRLDPAIEETVALVAPKLHEMGIALSVGRPPDCDLPFSKDQLKEMLLNLFYNSIDAFDGVGDDRQKLISIDVRSAEARIEIDFSDNGIGIRKKDQPDIFEPFFTTKDKGTGLGLYNIQTLLASVGGTLSASSDYGKGTTMRLTLKTAQRSEIP